MNPYTFYLVPQVDRYTQKKIGEVLRVIKSDGSIWDVPTDPANTDYQAYLAWVAEGNTAEEWQPDGN